MELLRLKLFLLFSLTLLSKMTDTRENITPDFGSHFSCKISNKTDAITFTFYVEELFLSVKSQLLNEYNFELNKNENRLETFILEQNQKTVITIYSNKTLFVQGKGSRDWKLNEFDPLIEREMANLKSGSSSRSSSQEDIDASVPSTPVFLSSSRQLLSQLINKSRRPSEKILKLLQGVI